MRAQPQPSGSGCRRRRRLLLLFALFVSVFLPCERTRASDAPALDDIGIPDLEKLVGHELRLVRFVALAISFERATPESLAVFEQAVRDEDVLTRYVAVTLLRQIPDETLRAGVTRRLMDGLMEALTPPISKPLAMEVLRFLETLNGTEGRTPAQWVGWWKKQRDQFVDPERSGAPLAGDAAKRGGPEDKDLPEDRRKSRARGKQPSKLDPSFDRTIVQDAWDFSVNGLDLVIVLDITDSMKDLLEEAKTDAARLTRVMGHLVPDLRLGLVTFTDKVEWTVGPSEKVPEFLDILQRVKGKAGHDFPEGVDKGLHHAVEVMKLRQAAKRRVVLIGDASPHREDLVPTYRLAASALRRKTMISAIRAKTKVQENFAEYDYLRWMNAFWDDLIKASGGDLYVLGEGDRLVELIIRQAFGGDLSLHLQPIIDALLELESDTPR